jgi:hypothetical protein
MFKKRLWRREWKQSTYRFEHIFEFNKTTDQTVAYGHGGDSRFYRRNQFLVVGKSRHALFQVPGKFRPGGGAEYELPIVLGVDFAAIEASSNDFCSPSVCQDCPSASPSYVSTFCAPTTFLQFQFISLSSNVALDQSQSARTDFES